MAGTIKQFEDIVVWQKSRVLTRDIYQLCEPIKDFAYKDQITRAAMSIMNNIAEGYERKGDKEFKHYLFMANGSAGEVRSMLLLGSDLKYFEGATLERLREEAEIISRMLSAFIQSLD